MIAGIPTVWLAAALCLSVLLGACGGFVHEQDPPQRFREPAPGPLDATYRVGAQPVRLINGQASLAMLPGSAVRMRTSVSGQPVYADIEGDGDKDAVLWLMQSTSGSGTFVYVAAALNEHEGYRGDVAVLLGDRVVPQTLEVRNGVVKAVYLGRLQNEAMAAKPTHEQTAYLTWIAGELSGPTGTGPGEQLLQGYLVIGHEVRSFRPCGQYEDLWLIGDSPALADLQAAYLTAVGDQAAYTPLFVSIIGHEVSAPETGFGAGYAAGLMVEEVVRVWPPGNCGQ